MGRHGQVTFALLAAVLVGSCTGARPARVVVLGLDGLDRRTVDRLIAEGRLPHFTRLRREGAYARLVSTPAAANRSTIWATLATGRPDEAHDTSPPVWALFSEAGRKVAVVGWRARWPAASVRGSFVSERAWDALAGPGEAAAARDLVRPPELLDRLLPLIRRPGDVAAQAARLQGEQAGDPVSLGLDASRVGRALAASQSYQRIALELWRSERPDLLMLEIPLADAVSYSDGPLPAAWPSSAAAEQVRLVLERTYVEADRLLGEHLAAMDGRTALVVVSDHGFTGAAEGVAYVFGHGVRRGVRMTGPTPLDVAPTILALAGLEPAPGMPGRAVAEALDFAVPGAPTASRARTPAESDARRAEAAAAFEAGRFEAAAAAYQRLVEQAPADPSLRASLAGALGAAGRYDDALKQLEVATRLQPLDPVAYHNRAATLERLGRGPEAIAQYRVALKYSPDYEPSKRALLRLTGSAEPFPPRDDQERRARELAEAAGDATRRKDYAHADRLLDQAERLAPSSALIHQYRANVAYLKGDREAAVRALEKALSLDPGNALYASNLESLRRRLPPGRP